jgi:hypothetical protein
VRGPDNSRPDGLTPGPAFHRRKSSRRRWSWSGRGRSAPGIQKVPCEDRDHEQRQEEPEPPESPAFTLDPDLRHAFLRVSPLWFRVRPRTCAGVKCKPGAMGAGKRALLEVRRPRCEVTTSTFLITGHGSRARTRPHPRCRDNRDPLGTAHARSPGILGSIVATPPAHTTGGHGLGACANAVRQQPAGGSPDRGLRRPDPRQGANGQHLPRARARQLRLPEGQVPEPR